MASEKRKFNRAPYSGEVLVNDAILARGIDISEGGLYVHMGRSFPLDSVVTVKFTINNTEINTTARVKSSHAAIGMGLSFIDLGPADRDAVRGFVDQHCCAAETECKKRIMLVDDDASVRRMFRSKLMLEGFMVLEATDGVDAINNLKDHRPDLVILDLYMDKLDGFKVLSFMKGSDEFKDIPVIVMSARAATAEMDKAMSFGADGFLVKMTTSPVKLAEHIKKFFNMK